uniref:G_PROTEIN_RECEP_F1_2 domain-containing protein n=1 Tax=Macrostomum lignano TaxID=282301 RepID=A0A1I8H858_9PLAT
EQHCANNSTHRSAFGDRIRRVGGLQHRPDCSVGSSDSFGVFRHPRGRGQGGVGGIFDFDSRCDGSHGGSGERDRNSYNSAVSEFKLVLVLPIAIMTQLLGYFPFGEVVCDFFISCDVLLCSSSILNLCAISIDRYLVITKPFEYAVKRTPTRMGLMIAAVWLLSAFISIPPMFGWKEQFVPGYCGYPELLGYQIYATFGAFYLPLIIMLVLYGNIFKLARKMAKADEKQKVVHIKQEDKNLIDEQLPNGQTARPSMQSSASDLPKRSVRQPASRKKNNSDSKAIKTLGVIMGCFTLCWLPFFIIQIVVPIYNVVQGEKLDMNPNVFEFFLWLGRRQTLGAAIELEGNGEAAEERTECVRAGGYVNSFMNPIIYAKFNRDFRTPFKHILLCHCKSINDRLRAEQFAEQYGLAGNRKSIASTGGRQRRRSSDVAARRARHNMNNGAEHAV